MLWRVKASPEISQLSFSRECLSVLCDRQLRKRRGDYVAQLIRDRWQSAYSSQEDRGLRLSGLLTEEISVEEGQAASGFSRTIDS